MKNYTKMSIQEKASVCAYLVRTGAVGYFASIEFDGKNYVIEPEDGEKETLNAAKLVKRIEDYLGVEEVEKMAEDVNGPTYEVSYCSEVTAEPVYSFLTLEEAKAWAGKMAADHIRNTTDDEYKKSIKKGASVVIDKCDGDEFETVWVIRFEYDGSRFCQIKEYHQ